jgi:ribbon-helix-helix CopG family protein
VRVLDAIHERITIEHMSDILAKPRTVRFTQKLDRSLSAEAARQKVSVSELIRRVAESIVDSGQESAGDWCAGVSRRSKRSRELDPEMAAAYDRRHK